MRGNPVWLRALPLAAMGVLAVVTVGLMARGQTRPAANSVPQAAPQAPVSVSFYGSPQSPISSGVIVPAGRATLWTSGTVPPVVDANAKEGSRERYGDTKTQATGILKALEKQLKAQGLSLADVVYLRVYVVPDREKGSKPDFAGWFAAYGEVFGTKENPTKPARSTISVPALVSPDWLIEIEACAVYPK